MSNANYTHAAIVINAQEVDVVPAISEEAALAYLRQRAELWEDDYLVPEFRGMLDRNTATLEQLSQLFAGGDPTPECMVVIGEIEQPFAPTPFQSQTTMTEGASILLAIIRDLNNEKKVLSDIAGNIIQQRCVASQEEVNAIRTELQQDRAVAPTAWDVSWQGATPSWLKAGCQLTNIPNSEQCEALLLVHLSSLDAFTDQNRLAGNYLGQRIRDAIDAWPVERLLFLIDQEWEYRGAQSTPRKYVMEKVGQRSSFLLHFDEADGNWEEAMDHLAGLLHQHQVTQVVLGGVWATYDGSSGCVNEAQRQLERRGVPCRLDYDICGMESDEEDLL